MANYELLLFAGLMALCLSAAYVWHIVEMHRK